MKRFMLIIAVLFSIIIYASNWKNTGNVGFSLTQTAVNKMWSGGEQNSITGIATMDSTFVYNSQRLNFKNHLELQYGKSSTPNPDNPPFHIVTEAADKIYFTSTLMYKFKKFLNPLFMIQYDSQFTDLFDPSLFTETLGVGSVWIDKNNIKLISKLGIATRELYDSVSNTADDPTTLKVENFKFDSGINFITNFERVCFKMLKIKSEIRYFNTFKFDNDNIVWDTIISANVWKFVGLSLNVKWLFNKKIGNITYVFPKDHQLLETLTITFNYSLF